MDVTEFKTGYSTKSTSFDVASTGLVKPRPLLCGELWVWSGTCYPEDSPSWLAILNPTWPIVVLRTHKVQIFLGYRRLLFTHILSPGWGDLRSESRDRAMLFAGI